MTTRFVGEVLTSLWQGLLLPLLAIIAPVRGMRQCSQSGRVSAHTLDESHAHRTHTGAYVVEECPPSNMPQLRLTSADGDMIDIPARPITQGGYGEVFKATFIPTGLALALKRPKFGLLEPNEEISAKRVSWHVFYLAADVS